MDLSVDGNSSALVEYEVAAGSLGRLRFKWEQYLEVIDKRVASESHHVLVQVNSSSYTSFKWGWPRGQHTLYVCSCDPDCNIFLCSGQCSW